jgi:two-component system, cell cycle sensor histidine kinase and response regulator CckA
MPDGEDSADDPLFDHVPWPLCELSPEGRLLRINRELAQLLGYEAEALKGRAHSSRLHASEGEQPPALRPPPGRPLSFARTLATSDGSPLRLLWAGKATPQGSLACAVQPAEVDRSSRLEGKRLAEQQLQVILDHFPILLFGFDRDGKVMLTEGRGLEGMGFRRGQLEGRSVFSMFEENAAVLTGLKRALAGEEFTTIVEVQGRTLDARVQPLRGPRGEFEGVIGVATDITPHTATLQALREQREGFRQLIETMPDAVAVVRDGALVYVNPALASLLGHERQLELIGMPLAALLAPGEPPEFSPSVPQGSASLAQRTLVCRNGTSRTVEVAPMPVDFEGAPALLLVARDLTERTQLQARLLQAERMVSLGTLAAGVAHEINNPLTYLTLNLGFVARELGTLGRAMSPHDPAPSEPGTGRLLELRASAERAAEALRVAKEGADRVALIVRDLRTFARADDEYKGPIDVRRVLDSSISIAWNEIRHRARLVKEYADTEDVQANEAQLGQVFLNLLMNAVQALPEGAAMTNEIRVVLRQPFGGPVIIEVRDTGLGIPPEIINKIFDPFFTTKPAGVSTGLGLSICHGIVTSMGGEITVESAPRHGSVFRVSLPPYAPAVRPSRPPPSLQPRATPRARALVIDDEPLVTAAIKETLQPDVEVVAVTSGREAIDLLLRDQRFDVILCDLMMPDIAGMDVYEAVRKARPGVEERFVLMTGGAFTNRARDFLKAVPNRCIDKPLDAEEIKRLVLDSRARR